MFIIKSGKIAFAAVVSALSVVIMYMASVLPTGKLALCAVASGVMCLVVVKNGIGNALSVYAVVSVISIILLPDKSIAIGYILFLGNYPVLKALIEKQRKLAKEWLIKITLFIVYAVVLYFGAVFFVPSFVDFEYSLPVVLCAVLLIASVYDVALSLLVTELVRRFSRILNR